MKALSIYPEPVMEIFMGDKTIEYRSWQTDYRGDLLICAGSKKEPGFVNGYPELELGLARYPSQKAGAIKWLQGLIKRKKNSGRAAYNEKLNLLCLLWMAEALGEKRTALKKAVDTAMAFNTMPERREAYQKVIPFDRIKALVDNSQGGSVNPDSPVRKEGCRITEPSEEKLKALEEAYEVLCKTGDYTQWVEAFEAAYGEKPVYIPQH